ncbi:MAG: MFS transporter [Bacteroidota bacterium]
MKSRIITRSILILSFVSMFTDISSEMLYPVMPVYLKEIGFSVFLIGILEGMAEATAGLSKGYFGKLSDSSGKRLPFVRWGYFLSTISKPMMAVFIFPLWIFFARTLDKFGKGLRTGARDAMLSAETSSEHKGKVFGFHRGMDTFGAVLGPVAALIYLHFFPKDYATLFFIAFAPGIISVLLTFLLNDKSQIKQFGQTNHKSFYPSFLSFTKYWKESSPEYRKLIFGLLLFALFNSSDIFLLLKVKNAGMDDATVIKVYIFYNLVYAITSFPLGILADRIGLKIIFVCGLIIFAGVYFGMSVNTNSIMFYVLFFGYGLYASATEGISKAWITNIAEKKDTATAIGTYTAFQSLCAMSASTITGIIWYKTNAEIALMVSAVFTVIIVFYFVLLVPSGKRK